MPTSIRWRLPLSYGVIAFLTVFSLGGALLLVLNNYYGQQERRYLEQNALAVSQLTSTLLEGPELDVTSQQELIQSQVDSLAYLTQTRIEIFGADGTLLADSGDPRSLRVATSLSLQVDLNEEGQSISQSIGREAGADAYTTALVIENEGGRFESQTTVSGNLLEPSAGIEGQAAELAGLQPPGSFGLSSATDARSNAVFRQDLVDLNGDRAGRIVLSQGPAFGRSIVNGVARGLLLAGLVAVLLAMTAGWYMSRRLSQPILSLVQVTEQMSAGDLGVRAQMNRKDELGLLASSFNNMAARIEDTVSTLKHFVADAAHEMNTPLTALRMQLDMAVRRPGNDPMLAEALKQVAHLEQLTDDLLQLSRLEAGIELTGAQSFDLVGAFAGQAERYAAQAEQAGLAFELNLPEEALQVRGDKELLMRAIGNLVDNGIKFTPTDGLVSLSLTVVGERVSIKVADTGIGIAADDLDLIFGRFHRGRNAAAYPGSGLGLAISRSIITAHGGQIVVESTLGQGTSVQISLPVAQQ